MRIEWDARLPADIQAQVTDALRDVPMPSWLEVLHVTYQTDDEIRASMTTEFEYRKATLEIGPKWAFDNPHERIETLIHEAAHVFQAPVDIAWSIIKGLLPAQHRKHAETLLTQAMEQEASDLAFNWHGRPDRQDDLGEG